MRTYCEGEKYFQEERQVISCKTACYIRVDSSEQTWLEDFAATQRDKIISGDQPRQFGAMNDHPLMMDTERVSETLDLCSELIRLIARKDFIKFWTRLSKICRLQKLVCTDR
jgi:hypothetical protein